MTGRGGGRARRRRARAAAAVVLATCLAAAGCGGLRLGPSDARGGTLSAAADLGGASYVVAGGTTTEVRVLCQLTIAALQAAGAEASDQCAKVGAVDVRRPSAQTEVDTGWIYLGAPDRDGGDRPPVPPRPSRATVATPAAGAAADAALGVTRLAPTAFGDADAVVVAGPAGTGPDTVSALAARSRAPGARPWCVSTGAASDPARGPALVAAYGIPGDEVRVLDEAAVFAGVATGSCAAGVVGGTSGRIPALGLHPVTDDRGVLSAGPAGRGGAVPIVRTDVFAAHPGVAAVLGLLTTRLDDAAIRSINREVDQDGVDPRDAARRWLLAQGLIART